MKIVNNMSSNLNNMALNNNSNTIENILSKHYYNNSNINPINNSTTNINHVQNIN